MHKWKCCRRLCGRGSVRGNQVGGTFTLSLLGHTTEPIPANAAASTVKARIDALPNVGTVAVTRGATPDAANAYGREWTITFTSMPAFPKGSGDVDIMIVDDTGLTGTSVSANVKTPESTLCRGLLLLGGLLPLASTQMVPHTTQPIPTLRQHRW